MDKLLKEMAPFMAMVLIGICVLGAGFLLRDGFAILWGFVLVSVGWRMLGEFYL